MRIEKHESNVIVSGEQDATAFGFAEDSSFLIDAAINLYSDPRGSVIRELVSNAYDASLELNENSEKRVAILVSKNRIIIQDFGHGMSKDFMLNYYNKIGFSTKRDNDDAIGAFGLGRLSVLSYTNSYTITTVFEGQKTTYAVYRENGIKIDELFSELTEEESGTRVEFSIKNDLSAWIKAIENQLIFFDSVVIHYDDSTGINKTEQTKVEKINIEGFDIIASPQMGICLGKVYYPLDIKYLKLPHGIENSFNYSLYFPLNSGIQIPPARESIQYTDKTINILQSTFDAFFEKIKPYAKEFDNLSLYEKYTCLKTGYLNIKISDIEFKMPNLFFSKTFEKEKREEHPLNINTFHNRNNFFRNTHNKGYGTKSFVTDIPVRMSKLFEDFLGNSFNIVTPYSFEEFKKVTFLHIKDPFYAVNDFLDLLSHHRQGFIELSSYRDENGLNFEEYQEEVKRIKKEQRKPRTISTFKYYRQSDKSKKSCILSSFSVDPNVDLLKHIKNKYSIIFYNLPDEKFFNTFMQLKYSTEKNSKSPIILHSSKPKDFAIFKNMKQTFNLASLLLKDTLTDEDNKQILKPLYISLILHKIQFPTLNLRQKALLNMASPLLYLDYENLIEYKSDNIQELGSETIDGLINLCKNSNVEVPQLESLKRFTSFLPGLTPIITLNEGFGNSAANISPAMIEVCVDFLNLFTYKNKHKGVLEDISFKEHNPEIVTDQSDDFEDEEDKEQYDILSSEVPEETKIDLPF